jgi:hypothetical protein
MKGCSLAEKVEGGYNCPLKGFCQRKSLIEPCGDSLMQQKCSERQNEAICSDVWSTRRVAKRIAPIAEGVYSSRSGARSSRR